MGSEAPGTVTTAKLSPRKSSAGPPSPKAGSDISPPDSPPKEDAGTKSLGSGIQDTSAQRAELEELKLELEEAKSAVSKAEAEKDLAGVQTQVMQQEFEMESRRLALLSCGVHSVCSIWRTAPFSLLGDMLHIL